MSKPKSSKSSARAGKFSSNKDFSDHAVLAWMESYGKFIHDQGYSAVMEMVDGSGNLADKKGDILIDILDPDTETTVRLVLAEHKATTHKQLPLTTAVIRKIQKEAALQGRDPALGISFFDPDTKVFQHFLLVGV